MPSSSIGYNSPKSLVEVPLMPIQKILGFISTGLFAAPNLSNYDNERPIEN